MEADFNSAGNGGTGSGLSSKLRFVLLRIRRTLNGEGDSKSTMGWGGVGVRDRADC